MAEAAPAKSTGVGIVMKFFGKKDGQTLSEFKHDEWDKLTPEDKEDLHKGIADGTFNY